METHRNTRPFFNMACENSVYYHEKTTTTTTSVIQQQQQQQQEYMMMRRRNNSLRNVNMFSSCVNSQYAYPCNNNNNNSPRQQQQQQQQRDVHFLHSCALCRKPLGGNRDIFMYRGDTPFCSEECREEQIEMDEAKEKKWHLKTLRTKNESQRSSSSPSKAQNYPLRTSTVAAA